MADKENNKTWQAMVGMSTIQDLSAVLGGVSGRGCGVWEGLWGRDGRGRGGGVGRREGRGVAGEGWQGRGVAGRGGRGKGGSGEGVGSIYYPSICKRNWFNFKNNV